jgi:hypothetical protein
MSNVDKDIERLVVRQLDGEITENEQLELNRELIRNPEARRLMEAYARIDGLAAAALGEMLGEDPLSFDPAKLPSKSQPVAARGYHRGWWLVPGAVAAALLAIVVAQFPVAWAPDQPVAEHRPVQPGQMVPVPYGGPSSADIMQNTGLGPGGRSIRRNTGREVLGVLGDDGNVYWIEIDRIRTIKRPGPGSVAPVSLENL